MECLKFSIPWINKPSGKSKMVHTDIYIYTERRACSSAKLMSHKDNIVLSAKNRSLCHNKVGWDKAPIRGDTPTRPMYITTTLVGTKVFIKTQ